ncbi:hypothetical protein [Anaeromicropila populeti]|uniref:Uncharacterized protein n=1 Tax=Anaeromicropila populeti TaxID=37658 RepID=A0A1I6LRJ6_9FIRM|nr:hypothetical protein [Anaeromicropila populeti]SFS06081.1 hypothetical protein SAMN05661086_03510 [Anaeromicropila populeti]
MYPVSSLFQRAIQKNTREFYYTGTITTTKGMVYSFDNSILVKGSGYLTNQCTGTEEMGIGSVYAGECGLSLYLEVDRYTLFGAAVQLFFHLKLEDGTYETVPLGIYEVAEANRTIQCVEVKAYDYMLRFDKVFPEEYLSLTGTPYELLHIACRECGVELAQTEEEIAGMSNGAERFGMYLENDIQTYRDLLYYIAVVVGGFATINRRGQLEIRSFHNQVCDVLPDHLRFRSNFSDFSTAFFGVSFQNAKTNALEEVYTERESGLMLELGTNPFIQSFSRYSARIERLRAILKALEKIKYIPFDASIVSNPAYDLGDVIRFTGRHADEEGISCITGYTYHINGTHEIKGVGKNPRLAKTASKTDKAIGEAKSASDSNKMAVYHYINPYGFQIASAKTLIATILFTSKLETQALFYASVLLESHAREAVTVVTVTYQLDSQEISDFQPMETYCDGKHVLELFFPLQVRGNQASRFEVYVMASNGSVEIQEGKIRASIFGQGLVASEETWDGMLYAEEEVKQIQIENNTISLETYGIMDTRTCVMEHPNPKEVKEEVEELTILPTVQQLKLTEWKSFMEIE